MLGSVTDPSKTAELASLTLFARLALKGLSRMEIRRLVVTALRASKAGATGDEISAALHDA